MNQSWGRPHGVGKPVTPQLGGREGSSEPAHLSVVRNVPPLQGFSDERHGDVVVVRPMREHTLKEVAFYNHLFAVPSVFTPALDTKVSRKDYTGGLPSSLESEVTGTPLVARAVSTPALSPQCPLPGVLAVPPSTLGAHTGQPHALAGRRP